MSGGDWHRVQNVGEFLADKGTKRVREHALTKRILNWSYCAHCGLVALKNDATRKALREKCITYE